MRRALVVLIGCSGDDDTPPTGSPTAPSPFGVLADHIPGGTLLSAWSDGDAVRFVGGDLSEDGAGSLVRWDGAQDLCVERDAAPRTLWWIHGPRPGEWYAVGAAGTILHETDGVRTDESVPTASTLFGVWAAADGRVFAVGGDPIGTLRGEVWVREAGVWSAFATDLPATVFKVWDRWFVGDGLAWHLEGDALVEVPLPEAEKLLTVRGRADDDVWAVGGTSRATLLRWDGAAWTRVEVDPFCASQPLNGVWTGPGEDIWIAGSSGAMARFDGAAWECPRPPVSAEHFHGVWKHGDDVLWAGGNLFSAGANYGTIGRYGVPPVGPLTATDCP